MPTRPELSVHPDVGGVGGSLNRGLSALSLDESSHSWTDDLPVCHFSGLGQSVNQIYRENGIRKEEHQFEDRSFRFRWDDNTFFYGVFDGHDGSRASEFASQRMPAEVLLDQLSGNDRDEDVKEVLMQAFHSVEKGFFEMIDDYLADKTSLQLQLQGLSSYEAYQQYPQVVERLREAMVDVSGGTTAAVALIRNNKLHIANVGDSRALLCKRMNGVMRVFQLSVDHDIKNEDELLRLSQLGLDIDKIRCGSKLGNQENTRCIGNYSVKGGYKDFDILSVAKEEPVIAEPEICVGIPIDENCKFLLLMSDGLYKSLEEATGTTQANLDIAELVLEQFSIQSTLTGVAQAVVDRIVRIHHDTYMRDTQGARNCQKRDDITLLVRNFNQPLPNALQTTPNSVSPLQLAHPIVQQAQTPNAIFPMWPAVKRYQDNEPQEKTITETSSSVSQQLFQTNRSSGTLTLDDNERIAPYVDFTDYYAAIEEAKLKGELPAGIQFE